MISTGIDFLWGHLLSSSLFLIIGLHYWLNPPKKYTVRPEYNVPSKMTQLNEDTWKESFQYSGKIATIGSTLLLIIGLPLTFLISTSNLSEEQFLGLNLVSMVITMIVLAVTIFVTTENHMEKIFDKKGNRKK